MSAPSIIWRYFAIPSADNIADRLLELSLDKATWVPAQRVSPNDVPARDVKAAPRCIYGESLFWWRVMTGPGMTLDPPTGLVRVYGRLSIPPEVIYVQWRRLLSYAERSFDE